MWYGALLGRVAQQHGHTATLLPVAYVRPFVRGNQNRPHGCGGLARRGPIRSGDIPCVPVKSVTQQALVAAHRVRQQWVSARTARINALRGLLREHGVLLPATARAAVRAIPTVLDDPEMPLPAPLRQALRLVYEEVRDLEDRIEVLEQDLRTLAEADPVIVRLRSIPAASGSSRRPRWSAPSGIFTRSGARGSLPAGWG
jgi:transposase